MTHVDDLYEPGDDREPEPCEWYPAPELVDLDEIEAAHAAHLAGDASAEGKEAATCVLDAVPGLVAELREARQRIAEFEALPIREDWTVTPRRDVVPDPLMRTFDSGDLTAEAAAKNGWQLWRQRSSVHPWEPIDIDRPF